MEIHGREQMRLKKDDDGQYISNQIVFEEFIKQVKCLHCHIDSCVIYFFGMFIHACYQVNKHGSGKAHDAPSKVFGGIDSFSSPRASINNADINTLK